MSHSLPRPATSISTHQHKVPSSPPARHGRKRIRRSTSVTDLHFPLRAEERNRAATKEMNRIIAKIQEDNKILADLEKRSGGELLSGRGVKL